MIYKVARMARFFSRWFPAIILMAAIFMFSSIPSQEMPSFGFWDTIVKKSGHMIGYALLGFSYLRAIRVRSNWTYLAALLAVLVYAFTDEFHQSFVAGRNSSFIDVGIDTAGACLGMIALRIVSGLRKIVFYKI
jgi:VanZ family protein